MTASSPATGQGRGRAPGRTSCRDPVACCAPPCRPRCLQALLQPASGAASPIASPEPRSRPCLGSQPSLSQLQGAPLLQPILQHASSFWPSLKASQLPATPCCKASGATARRRSRLLPCAVTLLTRRLPLAARVPSNPASQRCATGADQMQPPRCPCGHPTVVPGGGTACLASSSTRTNARG